MKLIGFEIRNFQSHAETKVDLTDGLNGFLGPSMAGKSAMFRALKWNLRNEPSGDKFIRNGESEASVVTHWEDGHSIERTRNRSGKNLYVVYKDGEMVEEFTGFGTNVPNLVNEIGKMGEGLFNFAGQLEGPFLLSATPSKRAESVGNLEELGRIDSEITNVNQEISGLHKEEKRLMKELQAEKKKLSKLEIDIEQEADKVAFLQMIKRSIEEKQQLIQKLEKNRERLEQIVNETHELELEVERASRIQEAWDDSLPEKVQNTKRLQTVHARLHEIDRELNEIHYLSEETLHELTRLTNLITSLKTTFHTLENLYQQLERNEQEKIKATGSYKPVVAKLDLSAIDIEIEQYMVLFRYFKRLQEIEKEEAEAKAVIVEAQSKVENYLNEFVQAITDEQICPTCSQSTQSVSIEQIKQTI